MEMIKTGTHKLVLDGVSKRVGEEKPRDYMGASMLGIECDRQLWFDYHKKKPIDNPRIQMIFDVGHILEDYVIKILLDAGLDVWTKDENGEQFGFVDGPIAGHIDGVVKGLPESDVSHLLEIKTANAKRFKEFTERGCKLTNKRYWVQCQVYMYKFNLNRCLFVVLNKDNCDLYFERIEKDGTAGDMAMMRGEELTMTKDLPERKYKKSTFFKCRFCNHNEECWSSEQDAG